VAHPGRRHSDFLGTDFDALRYRCPVSTPKTEVVNQLVT
jgi:hypothetical protein